MEDIATVLTEAPPHLHTQYIMSITHQDCQWSLRAGKLERPPIPRALASFNCVTTHESHTMSSLHTAQVVEFQFAVIDFSTDEGDGVLVTVVRRGAIATPVTLSLTPRAHSPGSEDSATGGHEIST